MKNLMKKEIILCMHPTSILFLLLSSMLLIPNYPYLIIFFYNGLSVFFTCLNGRENHDVFYSMTLPVAKKDVVKARFALVVALQLLQVVLLAPFAVLRQTFNLPGNQVGIDANIALFGFAFVFLGLFNWVFFSIYYQNVTQVGKAFGWASVVGFFYIMVVETCAHIVPFVKDRLDTTDPLFLGEKLAVLCVGIAMYVAFTLLVYKKSVRLFEQNDL